MLFKLSNLNSNLAQTLGYCNPGLNNSALVCQVKQRMLTSYGRFMLYCLIFNFMTA